MLGVKVPTDKGATGQSGRTFEPGLKAQDQANPQVWIL
jgi:hypothetical protein